LQPRPVDQGQVRRGAKVRVKGHEGDHTVVATGAHRVRVQPVGQPREVSFVVGRAEIERVVTTAPPPTRRSKPGTAALRLPATGTDPQVAAEVVLAWVGRHLEAEREGLLEALIERLAKHDA
jgi:hypothetical protein